MSRMPPSFSGGLPCASAAVADIASAAAKMPAKLCFMKSLPYRAALMAAWLFAIMPHGCCRKHARMRATCAASARSALDGARINCRAHVLPQNGIGAHVLAAKCFAPSIGCRDSSSRRRVAGAKQDDAGRRASARRRPHSGDGALMRPRCGRRRNRRRSVSRRLHREPRATKSTTWDTLSTYAYPTWPSRFATFALELEQQRNLSGIRDATASAHRRTSSRRGSHAIAAPAQFEPQGEGRVAAIVDARSVRLDDGREVRLAGIEPTATTRQALTSRPRRGRDVTLRGEDDTPDRYGRQGAFVFVGGKRDSRAGDAARPGRRPRLRRDRGQGLRGGADGRGDRGAAAKKGQLG